MDNYSPAAGKPTEYSQLPWKAPFDIWTGNQDLVQSSVVGTGKWSVVVTGLSEAAAVASRKRMMMVHFAYLTRSNTGCSPGSGKTNLALVIGKTMGWWNRFGN